MTENQAPPRAWASAKLRAPRFPLDALRHYAQDAQTWTMYTELRGYSNGSKARAFDRAPLGPH